MENQNSGKGEPISCFTQQPFVLASFSPRRRQLLKMLGLNFEVIPANVREDVLDGESPREHAARLATAKAIAVGKTVPNCWIIGADTIVVIDGVILGKPKSEEDAFLMLQKLSGREHNVVTGFCVYHHNTNQSRNGVITSLVTIKKLDTSEIKAYIKTGEPFDKAGAYAIQGIGMFMIKKISGSHTNVIGLPVCEVIDTLKSVGVVQCSGKG